jgi:hypothetical protein
VNCGWFGYNARHCSNREPGKSAGWRTTVIGRLRAGCQSGFDSAASLSTFSALAVDARVFYMQALPSGAVRIFGRKD